MNEFPSETTADALLAHVGFLRSLARGLLRDEHAGDDVVQDAWIANRAQPNETRTNPRAWFGAVVRNLASKRRRGEQRRAAREHEVAAARSDEVVGAPDESLAHAESLRSVTDAVLALDEPYRATILARYYEGLELSELARRSGEPLATVRSRHDRALAKLRERLDRTHGGDRRAWALGLVGILGGERSGLVGATLGTTAATGAIIVSTSSKWIAAVAAALVLCFGAWLLATNSAQPNVPTAETDLVVELAEPDASRVGTEHVAEVALGEARSVLPVAGRPVASLGSLRVHVSWSDGAPAAGVSLQAMPWDATDPFLARVDRQTDEQGDVRFDDLVPGKVGVYADRGATVTTTVGAGEEATARLQLPRGIDVVGTVVDLDGQPVASADIWLSDVANGTRGNPVTTSDAAGHFGLRDVPDVCSISARKPGHGPSPAVYPNGAAGTTDELQLVLQRGPASLVVRVFDPTGEPVPSARVELRERDVRFERPADSHERGGSMPPFQVLSSDARGETRADDLAAGTIEVVVATLGLAPHTESVEVEPGSVATLDVQLLRGVTLSGVVRTSDGSPLGGVRVAVGGYGELATRATESAADGSYRLTAITPGAFEVRVSSRDVGKTQRWFEGVDGDELVWAAVIEEGRVLRGRLIDERGDALVAWSVVVGAGGHGWDGPSTFSATVTSDERGVFRVVGCPDAPLWLLASGTAERPPFEEVEREGLRAGSEEVVVTVLDVERASSWIVGHVVGDAWKTGTQLSIRRSGRPHGATAWADAANGAFRIGPLAPGEYALTARNDSVGSTQLDGLMIRVDETRDLGAIVLGGRGSVRFALKLPDGVPLGAETALITTSGRQFVRMLQGDELERDVELDAGTYVVEVAGPALAPAMAFTVTSGARCDVTIEPRRSAGLFLRFALPVEPQGPFQVELTLRPPDGGEPLRLSAAIEMRDDVPPEFRNACAIAVPYASRYSLEAVGPNGARGSIEITENDLSLDRRSARKPLLVVLR